MPKVSAEHKEAVRRRIMQAAMTCLERNQYKNVTTREVLAEAGLSIGTFYNYFPTKEHLYEALAEEALGQDVIAVLRAGHQGQPMAVSLLAFLRDYAMTQPEPAIGAAIFRGRMDRGPDAAEAIIRLNQYVVREFVPLVEKAQSDGWIRQDLDAEALVELLDIVWDGLGRREATGTFQTSFQRAGAVMVELLMRGALTAEADPARLDAADHKS
jgi:AcrR family transcriptional regulator